MSAAVWWLAIAGLPVFQQPLPEVPNAPAAVALAAGEVSLRLPCLELACPDAEWMSPSRYTTLGSPSAPGALPGTLRRLKPSPLATRAYASLSAPVSAREWVETRGDSTRVGTTFGLQALRAPGTDVQVQLGTGYRLAADATWGTSHPGPIARGSLALSQSLGDRARLQQQVSVETGRINTVVRQTLGVDVSVAPQWTLRSNIESLHDSSANGGKGATDTQGSVKLKYSF